MKLWKEFVEPRQNHDINFETTLFERCQLKLPTALYSLPPPPIEFIELMKRFLYTFLTFSFRPSYLKKDRNVYSISAIVRFPKSALSGKAIAAFADCFNNNDHNVNNNYDDDKLALYSVKSSKISDLSLKNGKINLITYRGTINTFNELKNSAERDSNDQFMRKMIDNFSDIWRDNSDPNEENLIFKSENLGTNEKIVKDKNGRYHLEPTKKLEDFQFSSLHFDEKSGVDSRILQLDKLRRNNDDYISTMRTMVSMVLAYMSDRMNDRSYDDGKTPIKNIISLISEATEMIGQLFFVIVPCGRYPWIDYNYVDYRSIPDNANELKFIQYKKNIPDVDVLFEPSTAELKSFYEEFINVFRKVDKVEQSQFDNVKNILENYDTEGNDVRSSNKPHILNTLYTLPIYFVKNESRNIPQQQIPQINSGLSKLMDERKDLIEQVKKSYKAKLIIDIIVRFDSPKNLKSYRHPQELTDIFHILPEELSTIFNRAYDVATKLLATL